MPIACEAKVSDAGERVAMGTGSGAVIVKDKAALAPPPCPGLMTTTWATPVAAMSDA